MGKKYVYSSLGQCTQDEPGVNNAASQPFIRLLDLSPGSNEDDIHCDLRHSPLKKGAGYEALSYTWGSPERIHGIKCGRDTLQVTITLKEALLALRLPGKKRTLWIDQLCINQDDVQERNSQVKLMHLVYKYATKTTVFLGSNGAPKLDVRLSIRRLFLELRKAHNVGEGPMIREFQTLYSHPWFQRVWILQEIGMSDTYKIVVYYRGVTISWSRLVEATTFIGPYAAGSKYKMIELPPSIPRHAMIISKWTTLSGSGSTQFPSVDRYGEHTNKINGWMYKHFLMWVEPRLTEFLQDSRFCLATDPRDKIFSLLNMLSHSAADPKFAWLIEVDYNLPLEVVYTRAARYSIETEHALEILCYKDGTSDIAGLPTWVPDWTCQRLFPIQRIANPNHYRSQFHDRAWPTRVWIPPRRAQRNQDPVASFSEDGKAVTMHGTKLGTIASLSCVWEASMNISNDAIFGDWADIYTGGRPHEITDLPFTPEFWIRGIETVPLSICDFWLRVGLHSRLMTTDTLVPFSSNHPTQKEWKDSPYHRQRRGKGISMYRQGNAAFLFWKDWLAMMLPYASIGRRVAATQEGFFMLVPPETSTGDSVYFMQGGGSLGYVIRRIADSDDYEFVGAAYVHGFYGVKPDWSGKALETITIR